MPAALGDTCTCSICLDELVKTKRGWRRFFGPREIVTTPCRHRFHRRCIDGLETCPLCRESLRTTYPLTLAAPDGVFIEIFDFGAWHPTLHGAPHSRPASIVVTRTGMHVYANKLHYHFSRTSGGYAWKLNRKARRGTGMRKQYPVYLDAKAGRVPKIVWGDNVLRRYVPISSSASRLLRPLMATSP